METAFILLCVVVTLALIFDFVNGFHDAANTISTIVVTRTMSPLSAVVMAGVANFAGFWFGTAVAKTVGKGIIHIDKLKDFAILHNSDTLMIQVLLGALCGAVLWNILTWLLGIPTSSSHALIGGLMGSAIAAFHGVGVVNWGNKGIGDLWSILSTGNFKDLNSAFGVKTIFAFIVIAPLVGFLTSAFFTGVTMWICRKMDPRKADKGFKFLQVVSSIFASIAHGTNDAQKTMGVIAMAMIAGGAYAVSDPTTILTMDNVLDVHPWIAIACYGAISLGTMSGGWRIVKTMGTQITKIRPMQGFTSSISGAAAISACSALGIPVSTTHVIAGSIMGVGAVQGSSNVRWVTARRIVWAWFLTIPATAAMAAVSYLAISKILG
jgi:PiT family inorganic phosphate transporter